MKNLTKTQRKTCREIANSLTDKLTEMIVDEINDVDCEDMDQVELAEQLIEEYIQQNLAESRVNGIPNK